MSTSVYTSTNTTTFVHTATHLAGVITSAMAELLLHVGIGVEEVKRVYAYDSAIAEWIGDQALSAVEITFRSPAGVERAGYTVEIDYTAWDPEAKFRDQLARIRRQMTKEPSVKPGTSFEVTVRPRLGRHLSDQPGWVTRTAPLPAHGRGLVHGTAASGPGAAAVLASHRHE